tara:strand:- start:262 stop:1461 length:1200 start_codon:yes stop_codon:yes gene_type:complete
MSDSDTSSENINFNFLEEDKDKNKIQSSSTDMYNNLIANPAKEKEIIEETSSISKSSNNNSSSSSSISNNSGKSNKSNKSNKSSKKTFSPVNIKVTDSNINSEIKVEPTPIKLTDQQIRMKKIELLRKLSEIKSKGYELSKKYDFKSSIKEMEYEYELLKSFANKRNGIKLYKNIILNSASAIEFMNDKYDPFDFKLSGWSEHMSIEVDSYDDVLEELYEKYKGKGSKMPAEIKLVLLMVTSASAFHFTKSYAQNSVIETALKNNPGMIAGMLNPKKPQSQFMTQQEINLNRQKELAIQREKLQRENLKKSVAPRVDSYTSNHTPANFMNITPPLRNVSIQAPRNVSIQAPANVQDILSRLHNSEEKKKQSRIVSETTLTSDTEKRRGRKKKKNLISVL